MRWRNSSQGPGLVLCLMASLIGGVGCSATHDRDPEYDQPPDLSRPHQSNDGGSLGCRGRFCQVPKCPAGTTTEIVGRLYAGNGKDPIPGAVVFVPVDDLPEIPPGLGCDLCNDVPFSVASSPTDFDGSFR